MASINQTWYVYLIYQGMECKEIDKHLFIKNTLRSRKLNPFMRLNQSRLGEKLL